MTTYRKNLKIHSEAANIRHQIRFVCWSCVLHSNLFVTDAQRIEVKHGFIFSPLIVSTTSTLNLVFPKKQREKRLSTYPLLMSSRKSLSSSIRTSNPHPRYLQRVQHRNSPSFIQQIQLRNNQVHTIPIGVSCCSASGSSS